jgi:hypothetical protein
VADLRLLTYTPPGLVTPSHLSSEEVPEGVPEDGPERRTSGANLLNQRS